MKKLFILAFLIIGSFTSEAQSVQANQLDWHTDVREAITISNKEKKPLLMFFTGSDWCGWCIRLQNEVLKTPEFQKWAKENGGETLEMYLKREGVDALIGPYVRDNSIWNTIEKPILNNNKDVTSINIINPLE